MLVEDVDAASDTAVMNYVRCENITTDQWGIYTWSELNDSRTITDEGIDVYEDNWITLRMTRNASGVVNYYWKDNPGDAWTAIRTGYQWTTADAVVQLYSAGSGTGQVYGQFDNFMESYVTPPRGTLIIIQ